MLEIDRDYQLYRNRELERFELWWNGHLSLVLPDELDCRTVEYVKKTRRERADEIMDEITQTNAAVERDKRRNLEIMQERIKDYCDYEYKKSY